LTELLIVKVLVLKITLMMRYANGSITIAESPNRTSDFWQRRIDSTRESDRAGERWVWFCAGAVCFGLDPTVVTVRKARLTYGVGVMNRFLRGVHPESKLVRRRDVDWCLDVFDRFVIVDRPVSLGDTVLRRYTPAEPDQAVIVIHIYSSETPDVRFVTDPGVQQCGTLRLDLSPAGADQAADRSSTLLSAGARRREIQTRMMFGDTEIKVSALDVVSGRSVRAAIDFLNK